MSDVTPDEISRVAAYWTRVNLLVCDHAGDLQMSPDGITCAKCAQPLKMMSEIQLEEVRRPPVERMLDEIDDIPGTRINTDDGRAHWLHTPGEVRKWLLTYLHDGADS